MAVADRVADRYWVGQVSGNAGCVAASGREKTEIRARDSGSAGPVLELSPAIIIS